MSRLNHLIIGRQAERKAARFLQRQGLTLLEKNYHQSCGEIDLIMLDEITLVFVEVRYRHSDFLGGAIESVTAAKKQRIYRTVQRYLAQHCANHTPPFRFDILAFKQQQLQWLRDTPFT